jgi:hypothetical protein
MGCKRGQPGNCTPCGCNVLLTVNVTYSDGRLIESIVTITQAGIRVARSTTSGGHVTVTIPGNSTNVVTVETCGYGTSTSTITVLCAAYTLAVTVSPDGSYSDVPTTYHTFWMPNTLHVSDALGSVALSLNVGIAQYGGDHATNCSYGTPTRIGFNIHYSDAISSWVLFVSYHRGMVNPDYQPCDVPGDNFTVTGGSVSFLPPCPWIQTFRWPHDFGYFMYAVPALGTITIIS